MTDPQAFFRRTKSCLSVIAGLDGVSPPQTVTTASADELDEEALFRHWGSLMTTIAATGALCAVVLSVIGTVPRRMIAEIISGVTLPVWKP